MKTSVALCTFNGEKFIVEQIDSILKQKILVDELVIVDDGSTDDTLKKIKDISRNTNIKIKIYNNEKNLGFVKNFEKVLSLCSNDIIFLSDQDDYWNYEKVSYCLKLFKENKKIAGLTHEAKLVDVDRKWYGTYKNIQFKNGYGKVKLPITGALSAIRKDYLEIILPIPNISGHDIWIDYIFSFFKEYWLFTDQCLGEIRRHERNTSEWIVNSLNEIGRIDVIKAQLLIHAAQSYDDRLLMNSELCKRLDKIETKENIFEQESIVRAKNSLKLERLAIKHRQKIIDEEKRLRKILLSIELLFIGGYKYFNGVLSFGRDILRK